MLKKNNDNIDNLISENKMLKELVDKLEEEHITTFTEWVEGIKRLNKEHEFYEKAMDIIENMIKDLKALNSEVEDDRRREENQTRDVGM